MEVVVGGQDRDEGCRSEVGLFMQVVADDRIELAHRSASQSRNRCMPGLSAAQGKHGLGRGQQRQTGRMQIRSTRNKRRQVRATNQLQAALLTLILPSFRRIHAVVVRVSRSSPGLSSAK